MRSIIWLIIGFVLLSSCSMAFVYNEKITVSGKLDAKTSDELAQDSAKGSGGDQVYTRNLESDYGFSKLFSRYINDDNASSANEPNSYSMSLDAYGVNHGISFSGGKIESSNLIKIDDTSGVASYFNMIANGKMDESLKNIQENREVRRNNNFDGDLATSHVEGKFSLSSAYTDTKTGQDDARQLLSELDAIDVELKPAESEDPELNATKMQEKLEDDLNKAISNPDISPDKVTDLTDDIAFGVGTNVTGGIEPGSSKRGLELMNTAAFNESKSDEIFAFRIRPSHGNLQATRIAPLKLGRFPV